MIMCYFGTLKWGSGVKANDNIYMIELEGQTVDLETAIRMSQENEVLEDPVAMHFGRRKTTSIFQNRSMAGNPMWMSWKFLGIPGMSFRGCFYRRG